MPAVIAMMLASVLAVASGPARLAGTLAHIDRALANIPPVVRDSDQEGYSGYIDEDLRRIQSEVDAAVAKYGAKPELRLRIARCLLRLGRAEHACAVYRGIDGPMARAELATAAPEAEAIRAIRGARPGYDTIKVAAVPARPGVWAAFLGKAPEEFYPGVRIFDSGRVLLCRVSGGTARVLSDSGELWPANDWGARDVQLAAARLDRLGTTGIILSETIVAGNCLPTKVRVYRVTGDRIASVGLFHGVSPRCVWWSGRLGGLVVSCVPTYKVYWKDHYLWDGKEFVFANRLVPEPADAAEDRALYLGKSYAGHLWLAANAMSRGQPRKALAALRRAKRACYFALHPAEAPSGSAADYHDYGFFGESADNLKDIDQRIAWLERGDYGHALLFRPYGYDFQIPPYRLGRAVFAP